MSKRQYPEIRDTIRTKPPADCECSACDQPAVGYVRIAWDYMRGNDDTEPVCQRHMDMAQNNLNRFFAHCRTKKSFLAKKVQS